MGRVFEFVANCTDGVIAVDRGQKIVLWNEGATSILGFRSDEVLGRSCYEILRGTDAKECVVCRHRCDAITAAERLELSTTRDVTARTKLDREVLLTLSSIVAPSRRGELYALIYIFRDVTRQHEVLRAARGLAELVSGQPQVPPDSGSRERRSDPPVELTRREREIMSELITGASSEVIADRLSISPRTVRNHVNNILVKLGVHSRLEAVTYSIRNGLV